MTRFSLVSVLALGCTFPGDPVVYDLDGDGYLLGADCDDQNSQVFPTAIEQCNGIDDNCDLVVDEGLTVLTYRDDDFDGFGDPERTRNQCTVPRGWTEVTGDCDDSNSEVSPQAIEECDGVDNDCDDLTDEELVRSTFYVDGDRDGYGDASTEASACVIPPGTVTLSGDCNDDDASVFPGATEICDSVDQNCNDAVDEGLARQLFVDGDGDNWGNQGAQVLACEGAVGFAVFGGDCDDSDAAVLPGATEVCDGNDDDCDGLVDEGLGTLYYQDADGDTFGNGAASLKSCDVAPAGYVLNTSDCDDLQAIRFPGNTEICDYVDNDCDFVADEGLNKTWYADLDADGLGDRLTQMSTCTPPATHVAVAGDCDDSDAAIPPNCPATLFGEWTNAGGDAGRSGYQVGTVGIDKLTFQWEVDLKGAVDAVAIANGRVFASAGDGSDPDTRFVALDLGNGSELWDVPAAGFDWLSGAVYTGDQVCFTRSDNNGATLECYDDRTGVSNWADNLPSGIGQYMSPVSANGLVYSGAGAAGTLYAHNVGGGLSWSSSLNTPTGWGASVRNGVAYVFEGPPDIMHVVDPFSGDNPVGTSVLYTTHAAGTALVIDTTGTGYIAGSNGLQAWNLSPVFSKWTDFTILLNGNPAVTGGELYGVRTDGTLAAWSTSNGAFLRSYSGATGLVGPPVVTDDAVIASSATDTYVFDRLTGALLDSITDGGSLAVGENHLVLADSAGFVRGYTW